jgi:hypothetical protein
MTISRIHGEKKKKQLVKMLLGCQLQPFENLNIQRQRTNSTAPTLGHNKTLTSPLFLIGASSMISHLEIFS